MHTPFPYKSTLRIRVTFRKLDPDDPEGKRYILANPETVALYVTKPDKNVESVTDGFENPSEGVFYKDYGPLEQEGVWSYVWLGTGGFTAASDPFEFTVGPNYYPTE